LRSIFLFIKGLFHVAMKKPFFISHLITGRCNGRCPTCRWLSPQADVPIEQIIRFYEEAKGFGFYSTTLWGGEPLIRDDIAEMVIAIKRLGFRIGLITNGYLLLEKLEAIHPLDFLILSIDTVGTDLDHLRGLPGLYDRIIEALGSLKQKKIIINTVVSNYSYPGCLQVAELGRRFRRPVYYEYPIGKGLIDRTTAKEAFGKILKLKYLGYPISNSRAYLRSAMVGYFYYRCRAKDISITVGADGSITNCITGKKLGNVLREGLKPVIESDEYQKFVDSSHHCHRCTDSGAFESARIFSLDSMLNVGRLFISQQTIA